MAHYSVARAGFVTEVDQGNLVVQKELKGSKLFKLAALKSTDSKLPKKVSFIVG